MMSDITGCLVTYCAPSSLSLLTSNSAHWVHLSSCNSTWLCNQALPNLCQRRQLFGELLNIWEKKKMYFLLFIHTPYQEMTGRHIWAQMHQKPQTQRSFRKACDELNCSTYYLTEHESYIKQKTCLAFLTDANPNPLKNKWGNLWRWRKRSINAKKHPFREKKCLCCRVLASVCFTEHIHTHTWSQLLKFPNEDKDNLTQFLVKTQVLSSTTHPHILFIFDRKQNKAIFYIQFIRTRNVLLLFIF